jgi:thiamine biosynthesis lipoprotein
VYRHHLDTMGTVASFAFVERPADDALLSAIRVAFDEIEERFSLYRTTSESSRIARGELSMTDASPAFLESYAAAVEWRNATGGAFDPHRPDGLVDLSGIVKAQAIDRATHLVLGAGIRNALVSIGGDGVGTGFADAAAEPWRVGVVDPDDRRAMLCTLELEPVRSAIATSGTGERGEHVWRQGVAEFRQVTVVASDIVTADVLATAILAGGRSLRDEITERHDIEVLTVDERGTLEMTPRLHRSLVAHTA